MTFMKRVLLFALMMCGILNAEAKDGRWKDESGHWWIFAECESWAFDLLPAIESYDSFHKKNKYEHDLGAIRSRYNGVVEIPEIVKFCCTYTSYRKWVKQIGVDAFNGCYGIEEFVLPEGLTEIKPRAFKDCTGLERVNFPSTLWKIEDSVCEGCISLRSVDIPSGVTELGKRVFAGCTTLTDAKVSSENISDEMFWGCHYLSNLTISEGVTSIGANAFCGCTDLTNVTIPSSVTAVGFDPFAYCDNLASVTCLAVAPPSAAAASTYITDVMLIGADSGIGSIKDKYKAEGWTVVEYNLNKGCGSNTGDIYLLYKTGTNPADAITDFYVTVSDNGSHPATLGHEGRTYSAVECGGSADFIKGGGDLNWHAHGKYVYLYYTKDGSSKDGYIGGISFDNSSCYAVAANGGSDAAELNAGAHGEYIYMHTYKRSSKSDVTLYVPRGSKAAYEKAPYWKEFKEIIEIGTDGEIASQAASIGMDLDGQTTGIGAIDTDDATTQQGAWFTLDGRKVVGQPTQKGVYIRGGKKVMVK